MMWLISGTLSAILILQTDPKPRKPAAFHWILVSCRDSAERASAEWEKPAFLRVNLWNASIRPFFWARSRTFPKTRHGPDLGRSRCFFPVPPDFGGKTQDVSDGFNTSHIIHRLESGLQRGMSGGLGLGPPGAKVVGARRQVAGGS